MPEGTLAPPAPGTRPGPAPTRLPGSGRRESFAALGRPLLLVGLALVTAHFLDLALSGPATSAIGVGVIIVAPLVFTAVQPRIGRAAQFALTVPFGTLFLVAGSLAHVLDVFTSGPRWSDVTGIGFAVGGLLLVASGCASLAAPRRERPPASRARRAAGILAWLAGAVVIGQFVMIPVVAVVVTTHAMRVPVDEASLTPRHLTISIPFADGSLAGWYVQSRNGAAILVLHGSGGNRSRVARHIDLLARNGYGVLAIDLPGHGESDGRSNLLGSNAQPAIAASIDWLTRRDDVQPDRIAGLGTSLGAEVLLEAAARDQRLRAVIADGAERASDDRELHAESGLARLVTAIATEGTRAVSGMREAPPLMNLLPRIAPRRVLLIAAGGRAEEIPVNRAYLRAAGSSAQLMTLPTAGHTQGIAARPTQYENRVVGFLATALSSR